MNRKTRFVIAALWLAAGAFNFYAYAAAHRTTNLIFALLDAALFLLYLVMGIRS